MTKGYPFQDVAPNWPSAIFSFPAPVKVLDIFVFDYDLVISFTADGILWVDNIIVPANSFYSMDFECISFRVRNRVPGEVAFYQIIGYV